MIPNLRPLTAGDIPAAMALVRQVGWNQTASDWVRFLRAQPDGCFAASAGDRLVGTVTTIIYEIAGDPTPQPAARHRSTLASIDPNIGAVDASISRRASQPMHRSVDARFIRCSPLVRPRLAWIGMMLVEAGQRGQGIGNRLLARALEFLDRSGIACVKLDATPQGRGLYEKHGFVQEETIERWELVRPVERTISASPPLHTPRIDDVLRLDGELFGADRGGLLQSIATEAPDLTVVCRDGATVTGYGFGRRGTRADHLGPWMGRDASSAARVFAAFLERSDRPLVFVDCLTSNPWSTRVAEANGFRLSRPLTRMCRGANRFPSETQLLGAIVGPEFG